MIILHLCVYGDLLLISNGSYIKYIIEENI